MVLGMEPKALGELTTPTAQGKGISLYFQSIQEF
jgi:hypothetical protein